MFDREDIAAIARAVAGAVRSLETRLGMLEHRSSGIQSIVIRNHEKDRRAFIQITTLVDGRQIETPFKFIGIPQYREVYQPGTQYEMGDMVTNDGAIWVAIRDTTGAPGKSADWRLAVKRH